MSENRNVVRLIRDNPLIYLVTFVLAGVGVRRAREETRRLRESQTRPLPLELDEFLRVPPQRLRVVPAPASHADFCCAILTCRVSPDQSFLEDGPWSNA